ncbi:hypothetical protein ACFSKW_48355 [Nonomuraea mangrovi]|uniref:Uncharacterized protein n=2 Tax=Nonomuraea TaxID=83681 RepID=A0ABW4TC80_9ACTN
MTLGSNSLSAELVIRAKSDRHYADVASDWLAGALADFVPDLESLLVRGLQMNPAALADGTGRTPSREPGGLWAQFRVKPARARPFSAAMPYSEKSLRAVARALQRRPHIVEHIVTPLDERGFPGKGTVWITVSAIEGDADTWVKLKTEAVPVTGSRHSPDAQRRWAEALKRRAAINGACYGHVTDDCLTDETPLETALGAVDVVTVPRCDLELRGYSWVTVCAGALGARLGGPAALTATGAFDEVEELPGGALFLRATPTLDDYGEAAIERVFAVLEPVLIKGEMRRVFGMEHLRLHFPSA